MPGWVKQCLIWLVACAIGPWTLASPASADIGVVGSPVSVCIAPVRAGDTPAAMLRARDRFDCSSDQKSFGSGDFWARSEPLSARGPVSLRLASLWQQQATLWTVYADGAVIKRSFDGKGLARTIQLGAIVEIPLISRAAPVSRLLWRIDGAANVRGVLVGARLATPQESATSNLAMAALYGGFAGLCLAMFVYNLALWAAQRHSFQIVYCAMLLSLAGYAFSSSGALAWIWPDLPNNHRLRINYLTLAASGACAIAFARTFFEPRVFKGWLTHLTNLVIALVLGSAILLALATGWEKVLLDRLYAFSFLLLTLTSIPVLWQAWRRRSDYLWLFACAWALPILLAAVRTAGNFGLLSWSFLLDNSTLAAMAAEALLSSLAIAYRTRLLARERDEAREQEHAARWLADHDPLTGLLNRRAFLREAIGRSGDHQLVLVDMDHFKSVNQALGHDGGDEVLRLVSHVLARIGAQSGALVARLGGEEFALLAFADAPVAVEQVLHAIRAERMPSDRHVTASLGIATGRVHDEAGWQQLYRTADQALFAAKAAGRDRARGTGAVALAA